MNNHLNALKKTSLFIEELLERYTSPIKSYLPVIARFLLVVTFYEDALRITVQWNDQLSFMQYVRKYSYLFSVCFLSFNIIVMTICATMSVLHKRTELAVAGLAITVVSQSIGYGMVTDMGFMLRNASLLGGLTLLIVDKKNSGKTNRIYAGLPTTDSRSSATLFALFGRIMLVFLFFSLSFGNSFKEFSFARLVFSIISLIVCIMVVIGFKAKYSAFILLAILSIFNILVNNFWSLHVDHASRDYVQYDFFQTLSVIGGLLLLVSVGPGELSVDEKKKDF